MTELEPTNEKESTIQVKPSYISVSALIRISYGITASFLLFFLFLIFYLVLAFHFSIPYPLTIAFSSAIVTALLLSLPIARSEVILKKLCNKWGYSRFHIIDQSARMLFLLSMAGAILLVGVGRFYTPLPTWSYFLLGGLIIVGLYAMPFSNFLNLTGEGVLSLKSFLREFERNTEFADFGRLIIASKKISRIAQVYNMQISPHKFACGMTISLLEKKEATRKKIDDLIEWIENPTRKDNFKKFRKLVGNFSSVAEKSARRGIKEKTGWSFERIIEVCRVIVMPFALIIIAYMFPKMWEALV